MSQIALCPENSDSRAQYLAGKQLPEKYMEDFTLMGFIVDNYPEAVALVKSAGFAVDELDCVAEIGVDSPDHLMEIQNLFLTHKIASNFSDIADTIYQA